MHGETRYRIRLLGRLDPRWSSWLGLRIVDPESTTETPTHTDLEGRLDQSALLGVLRRLGELGVVLDSVERIDDGS